jgi:hypothetical protein
MIHKSMNVRIIYNKQLTWTAKSSSWTRILLYLSTGEDHLCVFQDVWLLVICKEIYLVHLFLFQMSQVKAKNKWQTCSKLFFPVSLFRKWCPKICHFELETECTWGAANARKGFLWSSLIHLNTGSAKEEHNYFPSSYWNFTNQGRLTHHRERD